MSSKVNKIVWLVLILLLIFRPSNLIEKPTGAVVSTLMTPINNVLRKGPTDLFDSAPIGSPPLSSKLGYKAAARKPSVIGAKYYSLHSFASYCPSALLVDFSCKICRMIGSNPRFVKIVEDEDKFTETMALILIDDKRKEIVVAFRGSSNLANVIEDVAMTPRGFMHGPPDVQVHLGFSVVIQSLYEPIVTEVKKLLEKNPDYSIKVVGHSLGGALAILAAYLFKVQVVFPKKNKISVFTYGQPRVGNKAFADYMNSQDITMIRVTNKDIIPHLGPGRLGYVHSVHELFIDEKTGPRFCNSDVYEDPTCSNSLGPVYDPLDHLYYFGQSSTVCIQESPISFVTQVIVPLQKIIVKLAPNAIFKTGLEPLQKGLDDSVGKRFNIF